jgi:hypothetical protein
MSFQVGPRPINEGLVLHLDAANPISYPGSGNTWTDLSGNGNNGSLLNGVGFDSGNGGSLVFDGVNDYGDYGNILNIGTGQFTLEVFAKVSPMTNNFAKIASKGHFQNGGWRMYFGQSSGTYSFLFQYGNSTTGDITLEGQSNLETNKWYHLVVCRDGNNLLSTYLNASFTNSTTTTFNFTTNSYNYFIGRTGSGDVSQYFKGNVAFYKHYNRALTAQEIQQNFNAYRGRFGI